MNFIPITHSQAKHLAAFIHSIRGDWDIPGIEDQLGQARGMAPAPDLAVAAIKAAALAANRTPRIIALDGPHWRSATTKPRVPDVPRHLRCSVCSEHQERCVQLWTGDHEFQPSIPGPERDVPKIIEALKADIQPMRTPAKAKTVEDLPPEKRDPRVAAARAGLTTTEINDAEEAKA